MPERIRIIHTASFLFVAGLLSTLFAVALLPGFRTWEVTADSLVIARNAASVPARDIAGNLVTFSKTDAYRKVFSARVGYHPESGRDLGDIVVTELSVHGSVLSVRGRAEDPDRAERIAREAALSLFSFAGRYYDLHTEADFRIIGIAPARQVVAEPFAYLGVSLSLGFGAATAFFLSFSFVPSIRDRFRMRTSETLSLGSEVFRPKRPQVPEAWGSGGVDREDTVPVMPEGGIVSVPSEEEVGIREENCGQETVSMETRDASVVMVGNVEEMHESEEPERLVEIPKNFPVATPVTTPRITGKKGSAPGNLPTAMTEAEARFLNEFSFEERTDEESDDIEAEETLVEFSSGESEASLEIPVETEEEGVSDGIPSVGASVPEQAEPEPVSPERELPAEPIEPTQEEYRRRLNELLRG